MSARKPAVSGALRGIARRHRRCNLAVSVEVVMRQFTQCGRLLVISVLAVGAISLGKRGVAQEVEVDAPDAAESGSVPGSVVAPSSYLELIAPLRDKIDLELYGFYVGDLKVPVAQVDLPIRTTKFLTITPSYMSYRVPASGLDEIAGQPGAFTDAYDEHQFRIAATVRFSIGKFRIDDRNMYVRRFQPAPADDSNRYRNRIRVVYPLAVKGNVWATFAAYEAYYDEGRNGGWNKNRVWAGVRLPLNKHLSFEPSYLWEGNQGTKDVHYLMFGLIVRTK
jgi:hypothetical protein